jgi:hypothetical protein
MRVLTGIKIFDEVGYEIYASTPISKFPTLPSVAGGYKFNVRPSLPSGLSNTLNMY